MINKIIEEFAATDIEILIPKNFTNGLLELHNKFDVESLFKASDEEFIDRVMELFPEAHFMNGKANETAESGGSAIPKGSPSVKLYGKYSLEADRAIAGVLNLKLAYEGNQEAYEKFVKYQDQATKLKLESFKLMHKYVRGLLVTPEDIKAALWSVICNDLGKMYSLIRIHEQAYSDLPSDYSAHDLMLGKLLNDKPHLFPGFTHLSKEHRFDIAGGFSSGFEFSQYMQMQLPVAMLGKFRQLGKKAIDFYILHSIFDISGAVAKVTEKNEPKFIEGSLTMHEAKWQVCSFARNSLDLLENKSVSLEAAYNNFLKAEGEALGIGSNNPTGVALIRIAAMNRFLGREDGRKLTAIWCSLPEGPQRILENELNINGYHEKAIFAAMYPAVLSNAQNTAKKLFIDKAKQESRQLQEDELAVVESDAIRAALMVLTEIYIQSRKEIKGNNGGMYISDCTAIAKRWGVENPLKDIELMQKGILDIVIKPKPNIAYGADFLLREHKIESSLVASDISETNKDFSNQMQVGINKSDNISESFSLTRIMNFCFKYKNKDSVTVYLAGTFNDWLGARDGGINPDYSNLNEWAMVNNKGNNWMLTKELPAGVHEFKYVVKTGNEFRWELDKKHPLSHSGNSWVYLQ